jgi:hypothetical protein
LSGVFVSILVDEVLVEILIYCLSPVILYSLPLFLCYVKLKSIHEMHIVGD